MKTNVSKNEINYTNTIILFLKKNCLGFSYFFAVSKKASLRLLVPKNLFFEIKPQTIKILTFKLNARALVGTFYRILYNIFKDLSFGYIIFLELKGVGFRVFYEKDKLIFTLGFSHKIIYLIPSIVTVNIIGAKNTVLKITGISRQKVKEIGSFIKSYKWPDSYKGKGIKYRGESLSLKIGKKAYR